MLAPTVIFAISLMHRFTITTELTETAKYEDGVLRCLDRDMPFRTYILHLDDVLTIKVCTHNESDRLTGVTEEKTLYIEEDFRDFLTLRGCSGLQEVNMLESNDCK